MSSFIMVSLIPFTGAILPASLQELSVRFPASRVKWASSSNQSRSERPIIKATVPSKGLVMIHAEILYWWDTQSELQLYLWTTTGPWDWWSIHFNTVIGWDSKISFIIIGVRVELPSGMFPQQKFLGAMFSTRESTEYQTFW